jgi:hypothetical protein
VTAPASKDWGRIGRTAAIAAALAGVALVSARSWRAGDGGAAVTRGMSLVSNLRLDDARRTLNAAVARHPDDPLANLWLAQAGVLAGQDSAPEWRHAAEIAVQGDSQLSADDRLRAEGLAALATERLPVACDAFTRLVARTPADLSARLTLADCIAHDGVVVPDSASPSGWRFRQSAQHAVVLYQQLVHEFPAIEPLRAHAYAQLATLLKSSPNAYRRGRPADASDREFGAFPTVASDTLVFVPYPLVDLDVGRNGARASSAADGLDRDRAVLRDLASDWVRDFPTDADAHERLATALENIGAIVGASPSAPSALDHVVQARRLTPGTAGESTRLRRAVLEVRLRVKAGQYATAQALADSVLRQWSTPSDDELESVASLAALTGRVTEAVDLERRRQPTYTLATGESYAPPPALASLTLELFAYSALGAPADSITALSRRLDDAIPALTSPQSRTVIRDALLARSATLAAPTVGLASVATLRGDRDYLVRLEQHLAGGDRSVLAADLRELDAVRATAMPGATSLDATLIESWVRTAAGDTVGAEGQSDATLDALASAGSGLLDDVALAGALPRLMVLRVDLGTARHEASVGRWASAACALWRNASAAMASTRERVCAIANE